MKKICEIFVVKVIRWRKLGRGKGKNKEVRRRCSKHWLYEHLPADEIKMQTLGELRMRGTANCISMRLVVVSR